MAEFFGGAHGQPDFEDLENFHPLRGIFFIVQLCKGFFIIMRNGAYCGKRQNFEVASLLCTESKVFVHSEACQVPGVFLFEPQILTHHPTEKIASGILTLEALSRLGRVEREPQKPMGGGGATAPTIHLLVGGVGCSVVGVVGLPHRGFQYSCSTLTWAKQRLYRAIQLGVDPPPFLFFRCANFLVNFLPEGVEGTSHAKCYGSSTPCPHHAFPGGSGLGGWEHTITQSVADPPGGMGDWVFSE